jgi:hypothetical protein
MTLQEARTYLTHMLKLSKALLRAAMAGDKALFDRGMKHFMKLKSSPKYREAKEVLSRCGEPMPI